MAELLLDATRPEAYVPPDLDDDQAAVVRHRQGGLRVLAGPGTGKTTTLVAAMASRLTGPDALRADQVLGLTFGRRAALNWRDQVARAVGGGAVPMVSTFHSFCYALVRRFDAPGALSGPRLLSGPEQQVRARLLFREAVAEGRVPWPDDLREAVGTRGMTEEIRAVMARTRTHAMEPGDLAALSRQSGGNPLWSSVASFMDEYLDVMDLAGVLDYSELIYRALLLVTDPEKPQARAFLHSTFKAVYVDEYQDTDPGQILLLKAMLTADTSLVVVGDFDQAIYGFRGADEAAILDFHATFAPVFGGRTDDVVLGTCRRFGTTIRRAAELAIEPYQPVGARVPGDVLRRHRSMVCTSTDPGRVDLLTFDSEGGQAAHIADLIAREHAVTGRPWSDMAVIVRSAVASLPPIYRALVAAGVPVEVAGDEIPIHQDLAVAPLLDLLRAVDDESTLTAEVAAGLLTGPMGGVDPVDLRRFGRHLRDSHRRGDRSVVPPSSGRLIAAALRDPDQVADAAAHRVALAATRRLGGLIHEARDRMRAGATPHEVLWLLWDGCEWGTRLRTQALGGGYGSGRAHRDLDAVCALFEHAARFAARGRGKDLTVFLDELLAQQIPAETLAENEVRGDAVRVLTAHRAKGLEWPFVIVAAVQEDLWPNRVVPATVLQPERIGGKEVVAPLTPREVLDAERKLFYVALTRARQHVIVTAVASPNQDDGVRPSSFFTSLEARANELGIEAVTLRAGRPVAPLSPDGVVSRLRRALADPQSPALARAAAVRLAQLGREGGPVFSAADPDTWWGSRERTALERTEVDAVALSGSGIEAIETCPAQWFLERRVHAQVASEAHLTFGNVLHKMAEGIGRGSLAADIGSLEAVLDRVWPGMAYDVEWESRRQRGHARAAAIRLLRWFLTHGQVDAAVECQVDAHVTVPHPEVPGGTIEVSLRGRMDRVELSADGVAVFDFKTGRKAPGTTEVVKSIQLALYEYMLTRDSYRLPDSPLTIPPGTPVSHTALVHLRVGTPGDDEAPLEQQVRSGAHDAKQPDNTVEARIAGAAAVVRSERYEARYNTERCKRCMVRFLCPAAPEGRGVL